MINERLRQLREQRGFTQQKVAEFLNIERSTYSYYELGKTRPDIETLKKLSRLFEVSIDYIADNVKLKSGEPPYRLEAEEPDGELTSAEKEIVSLLGQLPPGDRQRMERLILRILREDTLDTE